MKNEIVFLKFKLVIDFTDEAKNIYSKTDVNDFFQEHKSELEEIVVEDTNKIIEECLGENSYNSQISLKAKIIESKVCCLEITVAIEWIWERKEELLEMIQNGYHNASVFFDKNQLLFYILQFLGIPQKIRNRLIKLKESLHTQLNKIIKSWNKNDSIKNQDIIQIKKFEFINDSHIQISMSDSTIKIKNLKDEALQNLKIDMLVNKEDVSKKSFSNAFSSKVKCLSARQTIIKNSWNFKCNREKLIIHNLPVFVDCCVYEDNGIHLFRFNLTKSNTMYRPVSSIFIPLKKEHN
jgi:hypothetical protein